jgi:sugar phosphate isomerase/epimerase
MNRRQALAALAAPAFAASPESRLSMEGWIWMNLANRAKRPLVDMMDELFASAPAAGFRNIELNDGFFTPVTQAKTLALVDRHQLRMPSVYVGGVLHQDDLADQTIQKALVIAARCKPYGCTAVVNNPNPKPQGASKTDEELDRQAKNINRMAKVLNDAGYELRIHHHSPELENNAREWRHIFKNTHAAMCLDLEFVYRANMELSALVRETGSRLAEVHLRNRVKNTPLQAFEPGDIDYAAVAKTIALLKLKPLLVVELAYHDDTIVTRSLNENLRLSRSYTKKLFSL